MSKRTPATIQEHDTSTNAPIVPGPGQGKHGEESYLGYLLRRASAAQRLRMGYAMADVGVTLPQLPVLTMLRVYPGISSADLARLTMLTPQTVSVIVTNLECSGAITRRSHAVHSRVQHIDVTPNGSALLATCRGRSDGIERDLLENFPPKEEEVVRRWPAHVTELGNGKPTSQSAHRFSSATVFDVLDFQVATTIIRCVLRYIW